jgi:hypothetical protein
MIKLELVKLLMQIIIKTMESTMIKKLCIIAVTATLISPPAFAKKVNELVLAKSATAKLQPLIKNKQKPPVLTNKASEAGVGEAGYVCTFDARPQGFKITVSGLEINGEQKTNIQVQRVTPAIYTSYTGGVGSLGANQSVDYRGLQDMGSGKAINGGWARRSDGGTLILGKVAVIHGYSQGSPYSDSDKTITIGNFPASHGLDCDQNGLNAAIKKLNQYSPQAGTVPFIQGSSMAWNDNSAPGPSVGGGSSGDWAGGLYDAYYDANGQPGWSFSVTEYQFDLNNGLLVTGPNGKSYNLNNFLIQQHNASKAKKWAQYAHDREMEDTVRMWFKDQQDNDFRRLEGSVQELQILEIMDEDALLVLPDRFGTSDYLEFIQNQSNSSGIPTSSFKYPAYLFDPPKHPAWYQGNAASGYSSAQQTYSHEPLPSACNPANANYISPAFLNTVVLEELRGDWRYLTEENIKSLLVKDLKFPQIYLDRHSLACPSTFDGQGLNSGEVHERCDNMIAIYNPNIRRPSFYDRTSVLPSASLGKQKTLSQSKSQPVVKITKTSAYYQDLINNKLFEMNNAFNTTICSPKSSAIKKR